MEELNEKHRVTILVNGTRIEFESHQITGAEIKAKAGYSLDSELYRKKGDELTPISNDERVEIKEDERFVDFPATKVS